MDWKSIFIIGININKIKLIVGILKELEKTRMKKELESFLAKLKSKFG